MIEFALFIAQVVASAAGAYAAITIKLQWHRADINRAHARLDQHDERLRYVEQHRNH